MEESNPLDDQFFDAFDEFQFYDCISNAESEDESIKLSNVFQLESMEERDNELVKEPTDSSKKNGFRRRSSFQSAHQTVSSDVSKDLNSNSSINSGVFQGISPRERRNKILSALKVCEKSDSSQFPSISDRNGIETTQNQESSNIALANADSPLEELGNSSSSFLVFLAGLVIKAIGFQVSLLVSFFRFPIWFSYFSLMFIIDPFRTLKRAKDKLLGRLNRVWGFLHDGVAPYLYENLKEQKLIGKFVIRFGWGFFWSMYICFVLSGFLVSGFVIGGLTMRYFVEEPIQMTESLNFDYTKTSPVTLVPIMSCPSISGVNIKKIVGRHVVSRVIPPNHKLQLTISLTLPESDYNRKLGVFQVRADFLSENGQVTASSRHPCMLRFKSHLIRYLETFLKSVPLLAGYASEAQVLNIKLRGFTEGYKPTSCIRVILEQRAEYRSGAGIPELYAASLVLESELPMFKRILWYWKKTLFIWISMVSFTMELMLVLLCCRPILIPRTRPRDGSANGNAPQNAVAPAISC